MLCLDQGVWNVEMYALWLASPIGYILTTQEFTHESRWCPVHLFSWEACRFCSQKADAAACSSYGPTLLSNPTTQKYIIFSRLGYVVRVVYQPRGCNFENKIRKHQSILQGGKARRWKEMINWSNSYRFSPGESLITRIFVHFSPLKICNSRNMRDFHATHQTGRHLRSADINRVKKKKTEPPKTFNMRWQFNSQQSRFLTIP